MHHPMNRQILTILILINLFVITFNALSNSACSDSSNVNGKRLTSKETSLSLGDVIVSLINLEIKPINRELLKYE